MASAPSVRACHPARGAVEATRFKRLTMPQLLASAVVLWWRALPAVLPILAVASLAVLAAFAWMLETAVLVLRSILSGGASVNIAPATLCFSLAVVVLAYLQLAIIPAVGAQAIGLKMRTSQLAVEMLVRCFSLAWLAVVLVACSVACLVGTFLLSALVAGTPLPVRVAALAIVCLAWLAFAVGTFLVVPTLFLEPVGGFSALRRSFELVRADLGRVLLLLALSVGASLVVPATYSAAVQVAGLAGRPAHLLLEVSVMAGTLLLPLLWSTLYGAALTVTQIDAQLRAGRCTPELIAAALGLRFDGRVYAPMAGVETPIPTPAGADEPATARDVEPQRAPGSIAAPGPWPKG